MLNIFIMSLPFYFNNNPITYTDFLVFRTNKMIRLAVDIDFSRNTSSEPYNSYLKFSCFNINSNTISFTLLLVYQLIKSKNTTKIFFDSFNYLICFDPKDYYRYNPKYKSNHRYPSSWSDTIQQFQIKLLQKKSNEHIVHHSPQMEYLD